jgi:hypothetical protein
MIAGQCITKGCEHWATIKGEQCRFCKGRENYKKILASRKPRKSKPKRKVSK